MDRLIGMAVFVAATEQGSLVSAARRFGLSPSTAGKHVSAPEQELSVRLLQALHAHAQADRCGTGLLMRGKVRRLNTP
jgi:DNA-binding transcriptional LysR family regulator